MDENSIPISRLHAQVEGRVQGVGFRAFVEAAAVHLGLQGWVRNRWNGAVEVVAEGERPVLEELLAALQRGPRSASVTSIAHEWSSPTGEFTGFFVRRTD